MSTARRAYDLLRGYVHQEWERIQGLEERAAHQELDDAIDTTRTTYRPPQPPVKSPPLDSKAHAAAILGVLADAPFPEIRRAFDRLNKRSDPARFPAGSREAIEASEIRKRVYWAYGVLSEGIDHTERRFGSLEID